MISNATPVVNLKPGDGPRAVVSLVAVGVSVAWSGVAEDAVTGILNERALEVLHPLRE